LKIFERNGWTHQEGQLASLQGDRAHFWTLVKFFDRRGWTHREGQFASLQGGHAHF
jgi:hypothetical protein